MHQPVTNNPFVIMIINMVIVFTVLIAVWALIEITHRIDPTKKKAEPPAAQPLGTAAPTAPAASAPRTGGLNAETVAVIAAAVSACGCSASQIQAIRPAEQPAWTGYGRVSGMRS
ncbi:OadG family protein [Selenomonas sp. F0473]|uniref:OadG family protein n=1 Tax=Selenomonas sp. F0473 TaxID=999423 RepID=UPI00029E6CAB|nr:OadG family protein [Selenomonas sp. F0473]EKU70970.1 sodium pump decarboxylase, gamma subunit [Selenomonas sp. F0473]